MSQISLAPDLAAPTPARRTYSGLLRWVGS